MLRLFAGAALISLSPIWVKLVSVSPTTSGFYRVVIGGAALAIYLLLSPARRRLATRTWVLCLVASLFFSMDLWFWHRSIYYVGPGLSTLLANFQVFFVMLAGIVLLGQAPRPLQLLAVPMAITGLFLIVGFEWRAGAADYRLGVVFGLLTAVSYAGYLMSLRAARTAAPQASAAPEVAAVSLLTAIALGATAVGEGSSLAITTGRDGLWLMCYGVLSHCIGWLLIAGALTEVSPTEAGLALLLQPTLSFVWDVLFFARPVTAVEAIGVLVTLTAIYLGTNRAPKSA